MKTENISVTNTIYVWAVPKNPDYDDMSNGLFKFELSNSGGYHWKDTAICIHQEDVTLDVPAGIDLLGKAVDTIESKIVAATAEYEKKVAELKHQLSGLLQLTHQGGDPDYEMGVIEGELA